MRNYIARPVIAAFTYGAMYFLANRAIYYPMRSPEELWDEQRRLGATDVWLKTDDGVRLHAWWVGLEGAHLVTLFLHGNAGNISHRSPHIREIVAAGSSILIADFRGYGKSEGRPTEQGLFADGEREGAGHNDILETAGPRYREHLQSFYSRL